jgi:arylsulfatase A-like enzyme
VSSISSAGKIVKDVVDNIENTESGLFQWIHFYDVHDRLFYSYDCDSKIKSEIIEHQRKLNSIDKIPKPLVSDPGYFYSLSYVDHNINKIINELRRNNILDETLIVLTSDHGIPLNAKPQDQRENYSEEAFHVVNFYDEFYHIPLVFYNPKMPTNEVTKLTSSIDVSPTLVNAGGLKSPKEFRGENLFTRPGRDYVMFEHFGTGLGIHGLKKPRVAVRSPNWKIIMEFSPNGPVSSGEIREIYDLQNDPNETNNIKEHRNEEISELIDQVRHRAEEIMDNTSYV